MMKSNVVVAMIKTEYDISEDLQPEMGLADDLGFDSLNLIDLVSFIEESAGLGVGEAPSEYPILVTVQDAVDYFLELTEERS